jgi:polyisoprenoid-binding protein YceI
MTTLETTTTLPAVGTWKIDPSHSSVGFSVRHLGLARVRGRFAEFDGSVEVAEDPEQSSVSVEIQAASIDTRDANRDGHLVSGDFFDVEHHPTLDFHSTGVRYTGGDQWAVDGELTIRGVTRPVTLDANFEGSARDPWGGERAAFTATTEVDREDFGLTWNQTLETGGVLVGKKVRIELEVELIKE